ncbi:MAG: DUF309 domain-containing protein [Candidatus Binatia bacterium]
MALTEIQAPSRSVLRYRPDYPLPPYRYVPGLHPHPVRDPAGHSYEGQPRHIHTAWDPAAWRSLDDWLLGVDQYNAFYFWEAHEAWERLWAAAPREATAARVLQGLIQVTAALLKIHLASLAGATALASAGTAKLAESAASARAVLGLDLADTAASFTHYFRPLAERTLPPLDTSVPLLRLAEAGDA